MAPNAYPPVALCHCTGCSRRDECQPVPGAKELHMPFPMYMCPECHPRAILVLPCDFRTVAMEDVIDELDFDGWEYDGKRWSKAIYFNRHGRR